LDKLTSLCEVCSIDYKRWLQSEVDLAIIRSLEGDPGWGDLITFLQRRATIDDLVPEGSFPRAAIKHGDFSAWNVLMDDEGISG
jgi:predicted DNA-binding transcriptional regulator AlpA